jgi:hypothetical protein
VVFLGGAVWADRIDGAVGPLEGCAAGFLGLAAQAGIGPSVGRARMGRANGPVERTEKRAGSFRFQPLMNSERDRNVPAP